jgi:hypothetical protein
LPHSPPSCQHTAWLLPACSCRLSRPGHEKDAGRGDHDGESTIRRNNMALKDLIGKRTGRPLGSRTSSRVRRDILWAYNNLDKPDTKPPSPGAQMWAEMARREPDQFLACVARVIGDPARRSGWNRHRRRAARG